MVNVSDRRRPRKRARLAAVLAVPVMLVTSMAFAPSAFAGAGDVVNNPGSATFVANGGGFLNLAGNNTVLPSTATPTGCNDGINNDVALDNPAQAQDLLIDFAGGDTQCAAKTTVPTAPATADDSEIQAGFQARAYITATAAVDKDGNVTIPAANFVFPTTYVYTTNGVITVVPAATGPVTGTLDPATGLLNLHVNWRLELKQSFFHIDCASAISMDLSSDPANLTNSGGGIAVAPVAYNPATGSVTVSSNVFTVGAMGVVGAVTRTNGAITTGTAIFTDPTNPFVAGDVGRVLTIQGAGPGGTVLESRIKTFTNAGSVVLANNAGTTVSSATYTIADSSQGLCDTVGAGFHVPAVSGASAAQLSFTSTPAFIPGAVVAVDDTGTALYNTPLVVPATGVLANDKGTGLSVTGHTDPSHGTVSIASDGGYTYTPTTGYTGPDSFTYTATDSFLHTSTATVNLTVATPPPVAVDDLYSTPYNTPLTIGAPGVLANDTGSALTVTANSSPSNATVSVAPDGSFTFTPNANHAGNVFFTYTATDSFGQTDTATVRVNVPLPTKPPACVNTWQLNGNAAAGTGCEAVLTPVGVQEAGTVFFGVAQPSLNIKKVAFDVDTGLGTGADGITLFFGDAAHGALATSVGRFGGYLGAGGDTGQAIPGVGVGLDTYRNRGDVSSNFVGFINGSNIGGVVPGVHYTKQADLVTPLRSSSAKVTTHVEVTISGGKVTSVAVNGSTVLTGTLYLPPSVLIGFTSSTGQATDFHSVKNVVTTIN